ncbi:unnamed protein product [Colias eurytheme]|nr:unnamed protein product [Colias eurytheme]
MSKDDKCRVTNTLDSLRPKNVIVQRKRARAVRGHADRKSPCLCSSSNNAEYPPFYTSPMLRCFNRGLGFENNYYSEH